MDLTSQAVFIVGFGGVGGVGGGPGGTGGGKNIKMNYIMLGGNEVYFNNICLLSGLRYPGGAAAVKPGKAGKFTSHINA